MSEQDVSKLLLTKLEEMQKKLDSMNQPAPNPANPKLDELAKKLDSMEKIAAAKEATEIENLKAELAQITHVKLDSFNGWDKDTLKKMLAIEKAEKVVDNKPSDDIFRPKLDSAGKVIPLEQRVDWTKFKTPMWSE